MAPWHAACKKGWGSAGCVVCMRTYDRAASLCFYYCSIVTGSVLTHDSQKDTYSVSLPEDGHIIAIL